MLFCFPSFCRISLWQNRSVTGQVEDLAKVVESLGGAVVAEGSEIYRRWIYHHLVLGWTIIIVHIATVQKPYNQIYLYIYTYVYIYIYYIHKYIHKTTVGSFNIHKSGFWPAQYIDFMTQTDLMFNSAVSLDPGFLDAAPWAWVASGNDWQFAAWSPGPVESSWVFLSIAL